MNAFFAPGLLVEMEFDLLFVLFEIRIVVGDSCRSFSNCREAEGTLLSLDHPLGGGGLLRGLGRPSCLGKKLPLEIRDLVLESGNNLSILGNLVLDTVDVSHCTSFDVFGSVGILECVMCFFKTITASCNVSNHNRSTITPKTILEQPCQLGVPVRNVVLLAFGAVLM